MVMRPCPHQQLQYGASQVFSSFFFFFAPLRSRSLRPSFFFFFLFFSLGFDLQALPPNTSPLHGTVTRLHRASIDRDGKSLFLFFFLCFRFCLQALTTPSAPR